MKCTLGILFLFFSIFSFGQLKKAVRLKKRPQLSLSHIKESSVKQPGAVKKSAQPIHRARTSADFKDYYGRYTFYKDIYKKRNEVIIPINIEIWQKDDGTGNYIDNALNRKTFAQTIVNLNRFYTNIEASSDPFPWVKDYTTTKIHFVLMNLYFDKCTVCWSKGTSASYQDGVFLNKKANELHPSGKNYFKIHIVSNESRNGGFATFPTYNLSHEQYIVSSNPSGETVFKDVDRAWPSAIHLAHEMGHNLNLYHTYSRNFGACNQKSPDYLDDVFGRGKNAICPRDAGWPLNPHDTSNTATNNVMGGTSDSRYFSPKQVQRMHRALALTSIGRYAIPFHFNKKKYISIDSTTTWDFDIKLFTNLRINKGDTLIIKDTVRFVPQAQLQIEPGGVLIIDGGKITSARFFGNQFWKGIQLKGKEQNARIILKHDGKIENAFFPLLWFNRFVFQY